MADPKYDTLAHRLAELVLIDRMGEQYIWRDRAEPIIENMRAANAQEYLLVWYNCLGVIIALDSLGIDAEGQFAKINQGGQKHDQDEAERDAG